MARGNGWSKRKLKVSREVGGRSQQKANTGATSKARPLGSTRSMPAPLHSDDSDVDIPDAIPAKAKAVKDVEPVADDDDAEEEDEYAVEKILSHNFIKGKTIYEIKWAGYEKVEDRTWEPIENLGGAREILEAYHRKIGGTPEPPNKKQKNARASLGKRTASTAFEDSPAPTSGKKGKARKSEANGADWEPPVGSWEEHVTRITAIIESEDIDASGNINKGKSVQSLEGLLEWANGHKTQHKMPVLRQRCPQRLLDYYEGHLLKPKLEALEDDDQNY
ncbi:Putative chromo/chromo shadow domain, Chromo-like domain superfamily protein [Septoria linicola]|uniref:Chromo/chromo shadow domain, Chromo-like domain superfamily protein n=1 Tax=Septoria linicola TaxID=215465 RepID=A0A9Q9APL1_9PEZI|nr:putative chromo/chromo shadow domain, Chromo-like domain superfamily protein [Septoria linicola]USW48506.1 Putative chromo/chromo shadow domain, Chromo-like domain superfamily protein [Septoria linicola]